MVPWAHPSLHPKQHVDQFCHFCTAHHRVSHYFTTGCYAFPPKVPLPLGGSGSPSNTWYLERTRVINEDDISIGSAIFVWVQMLCCTMHCQWGRKSQKLHLALEISSPRRRRTEPQRQATCTKISKDCAWGSGDMLVIEIGLLLA